MGKKTGPSDKKEERERANPEEKPVAQARSHLATKLSAKRSRLNSFKLSLSPQNYYQ